jgi:hypothetical protein
MNKIDLKYVMAPITLNFTLISNPWENLHISPSKLININISEFVFFIPMHYSVWFNFKIYFYYPFRWL